MRFLIFLCFLFPSVAMAADGPSSNLKESLQPWSPLSISINNKKLTVVMNEARITNNIFTAVIKNGICMPIWLGDPNALNGVAVVIILNKFKHQGYVFEGGKNICSEMGKLPSEKSEILLLGHSHIFTDRK